MLLIPVFFGCETSSDLGIQYELDSEANVRFIEFDLPATNIFLDSLRTDGENTILIGNYSDPLTGSTTAEGYFQFFYEDGPMPRSQMFFEDSITVSQDTIRVLRMPQDTIKVDSIVITFESNTIIPKSGTSFQDFSLFELQDSLESSVVYLSNFQQTALTEIGSFSSSINTVLDTIYRFKLTESFSQEFFSDLSDIALDTLQNVNSTTFQSLGLISNTMSESIASFDLTSDTSRMIIYSSPVDTSNDTTYLTSFTFVGKNYTYLDREFSGSSFSGIGSNQDTTAVNRNFSLPSGQTIIDPLSGLNTAFSLEALIDFFNDNPKIIINSATMSFEFEEENDREILINYMNFFRKSEDLIFGPALVSNPFGNIVMIDNAYLGLISDPANGALNEDEDKVLLNATLFYQQLYSSSIGSNNLQFQNPATGDIFPMDELVTISPVDVTLERTIFKSNGIKLGLYYTETN